MSGNGQRGVAAVKDKQYAQAVEFLDGALQQSSSPTWLLARSQAHQHLGQLDQALRDAELAYHSAAERGSGSSRQLMIDAQYRRSVALFHMGRYADADCCAKWSQLLVEGRSAREDDGIEKNVDADGLYTVTLQQVRGDVESQPKGGDAVSQALSNTTNAGREWNRAYVWRCQALTKMETLPPDDPGRRVAVTKVPLKPKLETSPPAKTTEKAVPDIVEAKRVDKPAPAPGSVSDDQMKTRTDLYQSAQAVTVSLFLKGVDKEALKVDFQERQVIIGPIPREAAPYVRLGDRESYSTLHLSGDIIPGTSRYSVTPRKVELVLQKKQPGSKWPSWGTEDIGVVGAGTAPPAQSPSSNEATAAKAASTATSATTADAKPTPTAEADPAQQQQQQPAPSAGPAYPTSSKSGPKNWDRIEEDEEEDEKKDVNFFFKQLYAGATPDQQRAMMKSFVESNGTSLSTDWDDVKGHHVSTIPPEGVEAKKW